MSIFRNAFDRDGCCLAVAAALAEDAVAAPEFSRSGREARADGRTRFDPLAEANLNPVPDIA